MDSARRGQCCSEALALLSCILRIRARQTSFRWSSRPACATAVDTGDNIHYYYEIEPLGVYVAETISGSNIRFCYMSGEDVVKAG